MLPKRTLQRRQVAGWLLLVTLTGCGSTPPGTPSADEQFKLLADEKKAVLEKWLTDRESQLSQFKATMTEEVDINERVKYPHRGKIEFSYAVTLPQGEAKSRVLQRVVAEYQYSRDQKQWYFRQVNPELDVSWAGKSLVDFKDIEEVFKGN